MTTTAEATAAPLPITLGKGKEAVTYFCSPFREEDYGTFENWAQDRFIDIAIRNAEKTKDEGVKTALINAAYAEASRITFTSDRGLELMVSPRGMLLLCYLSLKQKHPDITTEKVAKLLLNPENADQLTKAVKKLASKKKKQKPKKGRTKKGPIPTKRVKH